jgi:hypothetical protein
VNLVNSIKSQKKELEQQRQIMIATLYRLLDDLEGKPVRRRRTSGFPFSHIEAAISWTLLNLERSVEKLVTAALNGLNGHRRR